MSKPTFKCLQWIPVVLLSLGLQAPPAHAQLAPATAERLHEHAVAAFRQARFSEAYGQLVQLANAGHAPSAELALWMYHNGPTLFGKDWDCSPDQLTAWAQLAGQPVPAMAARVYGPALGPIAMRTRRSAP